MKYSTANCIIDDENKIKQNSVYGENVKLYDSALVTCSKIGNNSVIGENSFIKNSILGKRCAIERRDENRCRYDDAREQKPSAQTRAAAKSACPRRSDGDRYGGEHGSYH